MKSQRQRGSAVWWCVVVFLGLEILCPTIVASQVQKSDQPLSKADSWKAVQALTAWFECEECEEGQLKAVVQYGQAVVPSLIAALNNGPSAASQEMLRRGLEARYDELVELARRKPEAKPASSKEDFVSLYVGNLDAQYRIRAAQALAAIGGTTARRALESALGNARREDVRATITQSLEKIRK
jgi:hypothetical protein